ncbi:hypothetical protein ACQKFO_21765 [Rossellomorea sp. NPDC071047]|jgi:hypothetical protein|uniref:hypothetical protein n=1 Tax=Rossellomorea sp. NPDC071047 TaxID=3390675 RepID=UPI003CFC4C29
MKKLILKEIKGNPEEVQAQGMCGPVRACCGNNPECLKFYTATPSGDEISFCGCPY